MNEINFKELTARVKKLVRDRKYRITYHVMTDHPERNITASDILECLKIGTLVSLEPQILNNQKRYDGADRYRWLGQDTKDRVLRLIVSISFNVIIISAAEANRGQSKRYLEDKEWMKSLIDDEDEQEEGENHEKM